LVAALHYNVGGRALLNELPKGPMLGTGRYAVGLGARLAAVVTVTHPVEGT